MYARVHVDPCRRAKDPAQLRLVKDYRGSLELIWQQYATDHRWQLLWQQMIGRNALAAALLKDEQEDHKDFLAAQRQQVLVDLAVAEDSGEDEGGQGSEGGEGEGDADDGSGADEHRGAEEAAPEAEEPATDGTRPPSATDYAHALGAPSGVARPRAEGNLGQLGQQAPGGGGGPQRRRSTRSLPIEMIAKDYLKRAKVFDYNAWRPAHGNKGTQKRPCRAGGFNWLVSCLARGRMPKECETCAEICVAFDITLPPIKLAIERARSGLMQGFDIERIREYAFEPFELAKKETEGTEAAEPTHPTEATAAADAGEGDMPSYKVPRAGCGAKLVPASEALHRTEKII